MTTTTCKYMKYLADNDLPNTELSFDKFCECMSPKWIADAQAVSDCDHNYIEAEKDFLFDIVPWYCTKCKCRSSNNPK